MTNWFVRTDSLREELRCLRCGAEVGLADHLDWMPFGVCEACGVECFITDLDDFRCQVVPDDAPPPFGAFVRRFENTDLSRLITLHVVWEMVVDRPVRCFRPRCWQEGEREAYRAYLRGKDAAERQVFHLGEPDAALPVAPRPRPRDFVWSRPKNPSLGERMLGWLRPGVKEPAPPEPEPTFRRPLFNDTNRWMVKTASREERLTCLGCGGKIPTNPPWTSRLWSRCLHCGVECLCYSAPGCHFQMLREGSPLGPYPINECVDWAEKACDDDGFATIVRCLCELGTSNLARRGGYATGELEAYREYLRTNAPEIRWNYYLGEPDDPDLVIPSPPPKDFYFASGTDAVGDGRCGEG